MNKEDSDRAWAEHVARSEAQKAREASKHTTTEGEKITPEMQQKLDEFHKRQNARQKSATKQSLEKLTADLTSRQVIDQMTDKIFLYGMRAGELQASLTAAKRIVANNDRTRHESLVAEKTWRELPAELVKAAEFKVKAGEGTPNTATELVAPNLQSVVDQINDITAKATALKEQAPSK